MILSAYKHLLPLGVVLTASCVVLFSLATIFTPHAQSRELQGRYDRCTNDDTSAQLTSTSSFAPPGSFFGVAGFETTINVLCKAEEGTTQALLLAGNGSPLTYIYEYGYERDVITKKWRKIKLSGENVIGPWILGTAKADLKYVPKEGEGRVLVYMCENVNGAWKCGCKDKACARPYWQIQKYNVENTQKSETPSATANTPSAFGSRISEEDIQKVLDDDYLSVYGSKDNRPKVASVVEVTGVGFSDGDIEVHFEDTITAQARIVTDELLRFTVPNIKPGVYTTWFTQGKKRSRNLTYIIQGATSEKVVIESIEPELLRAGTKVTIRGSGFTPTGNIVVLGAYKFSNVSSSDGKTLSFTLKPDRLTEDDIPQEARAYLPQKAIDFMLSLESMPPAPKESPMVMQVANGNGLSNELTVTYK